MTPAQMKREWEKEMEDQRMKVQEIEMKARFWKAQYDIRYYTLQAEILQPEYDKYITAQKLKNKQAELEFEEMLKSMKLQGAEVDHTVTQEDLDNNPELFNEGVKVGDVISYPEPINETSN
jgi:hypothetical protein